MLKKDLILRNPLRVMGYENDDILDAGEFGAVLARAGVGENGLFGSIVVKRPAQG